MRRILMVLTVALVMAAMLVVMAAPAFAQIGGGGGGGGNVHINNLRLCNNRCLNNIVLQGGEPVFFFPD